MNTRFSQNLNFLSHFTQIAGKSSRAKLGGFLLFLCLVSSSIFAQVKRPDYVEVPCSHYWTGKLYHTFQPDSGIKIIRKAHRQKEYNPYTGEKRKWKIEWVSDCVYQLTFKKSNMPTKLREGWIKTDTIVECYNTHYNWNGTMNGIKTFGSIARELTKQEKIALAAQKEQEKQDSIFRAKEDSVWISEGKDPVKERKRIEKEKQWAAAAAAKQAREDSLAALEAANAKKNEDPEGNDPEENAESPDGEEKVKEKPPKPEKEGKPEKAGKEGKEKKAKKEKPEKEKKAKKEKPPKEKKAKKEKPPKEKKEKEPKEKKEKPPKEDKEE